MDCIIIEIYISYLDSNIRVYSSSMRLMFCFFAHFMLNDVLLCIGLQGRKHWQHLLGKNKRQQSVESMGVLTQEKMNTWKFEIGRIRSRCLRRYGLLGYWSSSDVFIPCCLFINITYSYPEKPQSLNIVAYSHLSLITFSLFHVIGLARQNLKQQVMTIFWIASKSIHLFRFA